MNLSPGVSVRRGEDGLVKPHRHEKAVVVGDSIEEGLGIVGNPRPALAVAGDQNRRLAGRPSHRYEHPVAVGHACEGVAGPRGDLAPGGGSPWRLRTLKSATGHQNQSREREKPPLHALLPEGHGSRGKLPSTIRTGPENKSTTGLSKPWPKHPRPQAWAAYATRHWGAWRKSSRRSRSPWDSGTRGPGGGGSLLRCVAQPRRGT